MYHTDGQIYTEKDFPAYSSDVKTNNVLVRMCEDESNPDKKRYEAIHSDLGMACRLEGFGGTPGFLSPEAMRFILSDHNTADTVEQNKKYAQKKDMWDLGLVFVAILAGYTSRKKETQGLEIPPPSSVSGKFLQKCQP